MEYGIPPKSELEESVYLAWLDQHPPILGHHASHSASKLQCDFNSTLGIGRAYEIVEQWQDINWLEDTQFDSRGNMMGSAGQIAWEAYDKKQGDKA